MYAQGNTSNIQIFMVTWLRQPEAINIFLINLKDLRGRSYFKSLICNTLLFAQFVSNILPYCPKPPVQ